MHKKISKEDYYMGIAKSVGAKSNCLMVAHGCIIVRDDQIMSTGYVGAPRKTKDCMELGYCIRRKNNVESGKGYEMCRSVHAEMNAIINAARAGVSLLNGDMYLYASKKADGGTVSVKSYPCLLCKKMIINAGIKRFLGNNPDGTISVYDIEDWVKDWKELDDITQDKDKYSIDYNKTK